MRVVLEDPSLPHQIVFRMVGQDIGVSCNCLRETEARSIEVRAKWTVPEAMAAWRTWHLAGKGSVA